MPIKKKENLKIRMFNQLIKFGIIGCLAAAVHFSVVVILVSYFAIHPLISNVFAFLIAFNVSYFGHRLWTFNTIQHQFQKTVIKFFIVAVFSFLLNEYLFYIFLNVYHIYYIYSLLLVLLIIPPLTFIMSKLWAFSINQGIKN